MLRVIMLLLCLFTGHTPARATISTESPVVSADPPVYTDLSEWEEAANAFFRSCLERNNHIGGILGVINIEDNSVIILRPLCGKLPSGPGINLGIPDQNIPLPGAGNYRVSFCIRSEFMGRVGQSQAQCTERTISVREKPASNQ